MEHSDCSDPDSVESMTLHATPFFFRCLISALTTLLPTPTLLLVKTSHKRPTLLGRNKSLF